jgi:hypothetical protein
MNNVISLEFFKECINTIREQEENEKKAIEGLNNILDGYPIIMNLTMDLSVRLLEKLFDDRGEYISWWLWEDVEKVVTHTDSGKKIVLETIEQLYNFLIENKKDTII